VSRLSTGGPRSIADLTEGTAITRQAVTKHLSVLARAGLVRSVKDGRERRFGLNPVPFGQAQRALAGIAAQWEDALGRLRRFVERGEGTRPPVEGVG
jgi:DNA-binding transcriptional ArsR family regulator